MTHGVRAIVLSFVSIVGFAFVSGCGAADAVLGIHEAPRADAASVLLTAERAKDILSRAFTAAQQSETTTGEVALAAQKTAYTGDGLRAVTARVHLASVQPTTAQSPVLDPQRPLLLAVSRGFGFPRVIVAQTVGAQGSLPILHLLVSKDAATPYRISASVTMLPGATVKSFDPLSQGSPSLATGAGLVVAPTALLNAYAEGLAFPAKEVANPPFATDPFAAKVRAGAASVAAAVDAQATFSQTHKVIPDSVYAIGQASGDALVFATIERTDSFAVKLGDSVDTTANKAFVVLTGKQAITKEASITTLEFVVFAVPRSTGQATLVAASQQVVAGSGS